MRRSDRVYCQSFYSIRSAPHAKNVSEDGGLFCKVECRSEGITAIPPAGFYQCIHPADRDTKLERSTQWMLARHMLHGRRVVKKPLKVAQTLPY